MPEKRKGPRKAPTRASRKADPVRSAVSSRASRPAKARDAGASVLPRKQLKVKSPLTKAELKQFRQMLLEKRLALIGDMNGIEAEALGPGRATGAGELSNMPTHPADIGTDNYEQEFTLGLLESERALLADIDEALDRVVKGSYGICVATGKPIGKARLRARPWAKHCIEYARMLEKGMVRPGQEVPGALQRQQEEQEDLEEEEPEAEDQADVESGDAQQDEPDTEPDEDVED